MKEITYKNKKTFVKRVIRALYATYDISEESGKLIVDELSNLSKMQKEKVCLILGSKLRRELFLYCLLADRSFVEMVVSYALFSILGEFSNSELGTDT